MVIEYIRYEIAEDRCASLEAAYGEAAKILTDSGRCLGYEVSRGVEEPGRFAVRIEWDPVEGHEQGFRKSPKFNVFFRAVRPFFDDIREMTRYEATHIGGRER